MDHFVDDLGGDLHIEEEELEAGVIVLCLVHHPEKLIVTYHWRVLIKVFATSCVPKSFSM